MATLRRHAALGAFLVALGACSSERTPATRDTSRTVVVPDSAPEPTVPVASGWDASLGNVMIAAGEDGEALGIVLPTDAAENQLSLLSRAGTVERARVSVAEGSDTSCGEPRSVTLSPRPHKSWSIGLAGTDILALPLDSLSGLAATDSVSLVAELTRLASTLPSNAGSRFTGLPFAVRTADRFVAAPGVQAVAARLERGLNQEASPLVEELFLVAERDSGATHSALSLAWHTRVEGSEDSVDAFEVLAAVAPSAGRPAALVVARDGAEGLRYMLLRRDGARHWITRWTSAKPGC